MSSFNDFSLQSTTHALLAKMEITEPTLIQAEAIPALLAGSDVVGQSATGSGKTLAYSIPLIERLARDRRVVQALVLVPTRELAMQVNTVLGKLAASRRLSTALLVGGRPYGNQISALRYGSQIVVGTPGRVKDHLERGTLVLDQVRICVLDEADQMLDIGFAPIIEEILSNTPETRQMALFSATMPDWIAKLQEKFLKNPVKIDITTAMAGESTIEQIAYQVPQEQKMAALCTLLNSADAGESSLIFGKTKYGVEKLGKQLSGLGFMVGTLHGDKSQRAREEVLSAFRHGQVQTLLATNVAARGLDIKGIHQVINYELPESSELFTHRIGRTGRMGQQGKAITLLVPSDVPKWRRMSRTLGQAVTLQRLVIDHDATVPTVHVAPARHESAPMVAFEREREYDGQRDGQRPARRRTYAAPMQERDRRAPSRYSDDQWTPETRRRQPDRLDRQDSVSREPVVRVDTRQPEGFTQPERPYADRTRPARDDRHGTEKQYSSTVGKRRTPALTTTARPKPASRGKSGPATIAGGRRATPTKRPTSR